jgi:hypothetical protein
MSVMLSLRKPALVTKYETLIGKIYAEDFSVLGR